MQKNVYRVVLIVASSIGLVGNSYALSPVNSIQDGRIIQGGTYYNSSSAKTTFVNSGAGGLWLKSGTTVKGLEVNSSGNLTNNGGTIQLYAPGNVVRIDGKLDVSGLVNGKGAYLGDGGKVYVDAGFLYQNGSILANGKNGGLVQVDVGAVTLSPGAQIQAKGLNGAGGVVNISSAGPVDMRATINTSGWTVGAFDRNVINIEGGMIVSLGILKADGIAASGQGARGGTIRLIATGRSDEQGIDDTLKAATFKDANDPGAPTLSIPERDFLMARFNDYITHFDGGIFAGKVLHDAKTGAITGGLWTANGSGDIPSSANDPYGGPRRAGDGGTIILASNRDVNLYGIIQTNGAKGGNRINPYAGGNGGTISMNLADIINFPGGVIQANGGAGGSSLSPTGRGAKGGDGGLIVVQDDASFDQLGLLQANGAVGGNGSIPGQGGRGGLVMLGGQRYDDGVVNGAITANGALGGNLSATAGGNPGTVVMPRVFHNPENVKQLGFINAHLVNSSPMVEVPPPQLLTHAENLISIVNNQLPTPLSNFFTDILAKSNIRSVADPTGSLGTARQEVISKNTSTSPYVYRNLVFDKNPEYAFVNFDPPTAASGNILTRGRAFYTLNTFTVRNNGITGLYPGEENNFAPLNFWVMGREHNIFGGGHIALLATDYWIQYDDLLQTNGTANSGSILLAAADRVDLSTAFGFAPAQMNAYGGLHGGQLGIKSGGTYLFSDHQPQAYGRLMGGNIDFNVGNYTTDAIGSLSVNATGANVLRSSNQQAGIITIKSGGDLSINSGFDLLSPDPPDGNIAYIQANSPYGRGGYIKLSTEVGSLRNNVGVIEANGGQHGGLVSMTGINGNNPYPTLPQMEIPPLTPPKTMVKGSLGTGEFFGQGSVLNLGVINAMGKGGRIYLGGYESVVFAQKDPALYPNSPLPSLNGQTILPSVIFNSSNPNAILQALGQKINQNGQQVYIVVGNELTNKAGQTRSAPDIVNIEAAPNHSAPNVNPTQDGQGAAFTQDFQAQPITGR